MTGTPAVSDRERLVLRPPPDLPEPEQHGGAAMTALPMIGSLGSLAVMLSFSSASAGPGGRSRALLAGGVFLLTTLILVAMQLDRTARARRHRIHLARTSYLLHLDDIRSTIRQHAGRQRSQALASARLRIGTECQPLDLKILLTPGSPRADPVASAAAARLVEVQSTQPCLPLTIDIEAERLISIVGEVGRCRALARAWICSATAQQPDQLVVMLAAPADRIHLWDWLKWLPESVALGATPDYSLVETWARSERVLLLVDGATPPPDDLPGHVTVIELQGEPRGRIVDCSTNAPGCRFDEMSIPVAEAFARRVGSGHPGRGASKWRTPDLLGLLDLPLPGVLDPERAWACSEGSAALRAPIGVTDSGSRLELDLNESAAGGMGPHGLVVGATGSGKSELLRTLVLALALTHPSDAINLVLVDFKGGATFSGFARLPHVSALVTNLAQETTLVDRMQDALEGEVVRRQRILRAAGDFASVREYDVARSAGGTRGERSLPPLPTLLIIIDEFTELLTAHPEFLDVFVAIGRVGRSLGIHLVLASQRLEEGRLRGLEAHLSFRIALRTFSESESRAVIGVPDAAHLPAVPGVGLLRSDPATLQRFDTAYVSGPLPTPEISRIEPFVLRSLSGLDRLDQQSRLDQQTEPSLREAVVGSLVGRGTPARKIWLPPLGPPINLGQLFSDLGADSHRGLTSATWRERGALIIPLGIVDRPREQRRDVLTADLRGASGHFVAVGGPRSGKTTLLQTFVISTALLNTPAEARFFIIDTSGGLGPLKGLPHVSGLAGKADVDVVRRIVDEVASLIAAREDGQPTDAIFLVIDGWDRLNLIHPDLQAAVQDLGNRGLAVNVHLVVSASRWGELRMGTRELFGTRVELRQGDPVDSEIDRRAARSVPTSQPGRGIVPGPWQVLTALPHIDAAGRTLEATVHHIADAWSGPPAPALRMLPANVPITHLDDSDLPRLGVGERDLGAVLWDAEEDQHLLIFGDSGAGKTNLLRLLGHEISRTRTPQEAQLVVINYRRSLDGQFGGDHLLHSLTGPDQARIQIEELAAILAERVSTPFWAGPDVFVLVDDYDLVGGIDSPLAPLLPMLFQSRDVGLHLLLARRASGGSRALFEPLLQGLRDLGAPGVLLSGNPHEGPLLSGVRPIQANPGRGKLITRDVIEVCQVAWSEPAR